MNRLIHLVFVVFFSSIISCVAVSSAAVEDSRRESISSPAPANRDAPPGAEEGKEGTRESPSSSRPPRDSSGNVTTYSPPKPSGFSGTTPSTVARENGDVNSTQTLPSSKNNPMPQSNENPGTEKIRRSSENEGAEQTPTDDTTRSSHIGRTNDGARFNEQSKTGDDSPSTESSDESLRGRSGDELTRLQPNAAENLTENSTQRPDWSSVNSPPSETLLETSNSEDPTTTTESSEGASQTATGAFPQPGNKEKPLSYSNTHSSVPSALDKDWKKSPDANFPLDPLDSLIHNLTLTLQSYIALRNSYRRTSGAPREFATQVSGSPKNTRISIESVDPQSFTHIFRRQDKAPGKTPLTYTNTPPGNSSQASHPMNEEKLLMQSVTASTYSNMHSDLPYGNDSGPLEFSNSSPLSSILPDLLREKVKNQGSNHTGSGADGNQVAVPGQGRLDQKLMDPFTFSNLISDLVSDRIKNLPTPAPINAPAAPWNQSHPNVAPTPSTGVGNQSSQQQGTPAAPPETPAPTQGAVQNPPAATPEAPQNPNGAALPYTPGAAPVSYAGDRAAAQEAPASMQGNPTGGQTPHSEYPTAYTADQGVPSGGQNNGGAARSAPTSPYPSDWRPHQADSAPEDPESGAGFSSPLYYSNTKPPSSTAADLRPIQTVSNGVDQYTPAPSPVRLREEPQQTQAAQPSYESQLRKRSVNAVFGAGAVPRSAAGNFQQEAPRAHDACVRETAPYPGTASDYGSGTNTYPFDPSSTIERDNNQLNPPTS